MKKISEHLGEIIVALAAISLLVCAVVVFRAPLGSFFGNIVAKETSIADTVLGNMGGFDLDFNSGGSGGIVPTDGPGLYKAGSNYTELLTPWDVLLDNGTIVLTDGALAGGTGIAEYRLPDNLPELNKYGFYYGVPYNLDDGSANGLAFNEDGSVDFYQEGVLVNSFPAGSAIYSTNSIDMSSQGIGVAAVSSDGASVTFADAGMNLTLYTPIIMSGDLLLPDDDSVTSIAASAFDGFSYLTGIAISDSVINVGERAFRNCTNLTSVTFGDNSQLNCIGASAFFDCISLTDVSFGENSQLVTIAGVRSTDFDGGAFKGCTSLTSINIPDSVTTIEEDAFSRCSNLTEVTFGENSLLTSIGAGSFKHCDSLINFTIPNKVTSIANGAFWHNTNMVSITIPASVTSIDYAAFQQCSNLKTVYYKGSLEQWLNISFADSLAFEDDAFRGTSNPCSNGAALYINSSELVDDIVVPDGVTSIQNGAFRGCVSLTSITIPDSVTAIGNVAFTDCTALESINIPDSVTSIGCDAFVRCTSLTEAKFENPNGWCYSSYSTSPSGNYLSADSLSNKETAATYLKDTFRLYYWFRTEG